MGADGNLTGATKIGQNSVGLLNARDPSLRRPCYVLLVEVSEKCFRRLIEYGRTSRLWKGVSAKEKDVMSIAVSAN